MDLDDLLDELNDYKPSTTVNRNRRSFADPPYYNLYEENWKLKKSPMIHMNLIAFSNLKILPSISNPPLSLDNDLKLQ